MLMARLSSVSTICLALIGPGLAAGVTAQQRAAPSGPADDVVVVGHRPPRCRPHQGDPQDAVDLSAATDGHPQTIRVNAATGKLALVPDDYPETGPLIWQRAAQRMDQYVFRTPSGGDTVCIGARGSHVPGEAQLRRAFAAQRYWGKYMLLSALVAARDAGRIDMWIAAGARNPRPVDSKDIGRDVVAGGFKPVPITGNYTWRQVNFLIGPIPCLAAQISYGVQLQGGGDVWVSKPAFVEVPEDRLSPSMKRRPHGAAMLESDPVCRYFREGRPLWERHGNEYRIAGRDAVVPSNLLFDRHDDPFGNDPAGADGTSRGEYTYLSRERITAPGLIEF